MTDQSYCWGNREAELLTRIEGLAKALVEQTDARNRLTGEVIQLQTEVERLRQRVLDAQDGFDWVGDAIGQRTRAEAAEAEVERLRRWKAEATEVILGLQDLGKALGMRLGEQVTGQSGTAAAKRLRARADAAEAALAEAQAKVTELTRLLGSHADGHRCTCTMTDPGDFHVEGGNAHPPVWEQDPWCPTHPDVDQIRAELLALADDWDGKADDGEERGYAAAARAVRHDAKELRALAEGGE